MSSSQIASEFSDSLNDKFSNVKSWVSKVDGAYVVDGLIRTRFDNPWFFMLVVPRKGQDASEFETFCKSVNDKMATWTFWSRDPDELLAAFEQKFKSHLCYNLTEEVVKRQGLMVRKARALAWADGACSGNPNGDMGMGGLIRIGSKSLRIMHYQPAADGNTNNIAEVWAAILVMKKALDAGVKELTVHCDSKLVVESFGGRWKVSAEHLKPMLAEAKEFMKKFTDISFVHVPRSENVEADALAAEAIRKRFSNIAEVSKPVQLQLL